MLGTSTLERMLRATGGGVQLKHGSCETYCHFERVPVGVDGGDGRGQVHGTQPSAVIAVGALSAFGPDRGVGEQVAVLVPPALRAVLDHPAERDWSVSRVLPGGDGGDGLTLRLMLTEVLT